MINLSKTQHLATYQDDETLKNNIRQPRNTGQCPV